MDFPPYHHYIHNLHDPTINNVQTLLKPQPYQQATTYNNIHSITAPYCASHTPILNQQPTHPRISTTHFLLHQSQQTPDTSTSLNCRRHNPFYHQSTYNSSHHTRFLLQQMLQSQQALNHAISKLASDISTLNKSLTPLTHSQHITHTDEPTPFNTKPSSRPVSISHKPSHHYQPQTISTTATVQFSSPIVINKVKTQEPITDSEINLTIVHENELVVATKFVEPEITKEPHEQTIVEGDFSHTVGSVSQGGKEEIKFVPDLVAISSHGSDFFEEQKLYVVKDLKESFSATPTPSTEKKVVRADEVTPQQHPRLTFALPAVPIHIFDPGGTFKIAVNSSAHRSQIQFTSCDVFFHHVAHNRLPLSVFINRVAISSFDASPNLHGFRFVVFDPGGDECQFRSPARSAVSDAASGQPWVLWSSKTQMFASVHLLQCVESGKEKDTERVCWELHSSNRIRQHYCLWACYFFPKFYGSDRLNIKV